MTTPPNPALEPSVNALETMLVIRHLRANIIASGKTPSKVYLDDRRFYSLYLHLRATFRLEGDPGLHETGGVFKFMGLNVYRVVADDHIEIY